MKRERRQPTRRELEVLDVETEAACRLGPGTLKAIENPMWEALAVVPIRTPWKSLSVAEKGREYLAMVTYFRLRSVRVLPAFALNMRRINRQLACSEGFVGHSGGGRILSLEFWSMSVGEDEHALQRFVHARPHIEIMRAMRPAVFRSEFVRWTVAGAEVPPDSKEAEQRLHQVLTADEGEEEAWL